MDIGWYDKELGGAGISYETAMNLPYAEFKLIYEIVSDKKREIADAINRAMRRRG